MFSCRAQTRGSAWKRALFSPDSIRTCGGTRVVNHFSTTARRDIEPGRNGRKSVAKERQRAERDELTRLLKESPGKRDARNFLKHFDPPKSKPKPAKSDSHRPTTEAEKRAHHDEWRLGRTGVNLGNLYEPTKAAQNNPVFTREELPDKPPQDKDLEPLHLALVKLRQPQALDDQTLGGIGLTLSQMARLGLNIAVVVDCDEADTPGSLDMSPVWETTVREQVSRIVDALEEFNEPGAFEVGHALCYTDNVASSAGAGLQGYGGVEVKNNHLLFPPIEDGIIPVIPPFAYNSELKKIRVDPDDALLALTREFAGLGPQNLELHEQRGPNKSLDKSGEDTPRQPVLDRIIILEPLGGIPAEHRADGAHVFINLEAEYRDIRAELERPSSTAQSSESSSISSLGSSNPFSKFVETELAPLPGSDAKQISSHSPPSRHTKNLDVVYHALRLLPPSSSAIIITPAEAAISSRAALRSSPSASVRTRRSKNPLIHNLLTDKPMTSSSLPDPLVTRPLASTDPNSATFLKKGIPVTILPDPRITGPWQPPSPSNPSIELETDPRINFARLVDLIEDSFRRKLDARDYLNRIRGRIAGVIIAGDYEGGAICTWETPSSFSSATLPPDSPLWVPYLDKFAVLTKSQGSGGVADIVWGALTRTAFPEGVAWRSRMTNPVNKWYFERAVGMWNLPDGYWTMFWTTEGVVEEAAKAAKVNEKSLTRWDAYVGACSSVVPSWADAKTPD